MVGDVLHLVQEPAVDLGELIQLVHRVAGSKGRRQNKDALVRRNLQLLMSKEGRLQCIRFCISTFAGGFEMFLIKALGKELHQIGNSGQQRG